MAGNPVESRESEFVDRNLRHNFVALGVDYALFLVGLAFVSQTTVLPAFALHLGASNVLIGAIPALMTVGWFLPSLFAAGHTETLSRKLPFVLRYSIWERVPFLVLAAAAFGLADRAPALALVTLYAMLLLLTTVGGVLLPAWMDIVGRTIPLTLRGRFFGVGSLLGSVGAFFASFGTAYILAALPAPTSYGACFLGSAVFMAVSYLALMLTREPPGGEPSPAVPLRAYLRRVPDLLRRDPNLGWFLLARAFAVAGQMATGFYTVHALGGGAPIERVGVFTVLLLGGQMVGNLAFGWLADRAGHRVVIVAGVAAAVAANAVALSAPPPAVFGLVFALAGVQAAATSVSNFAVLLEFAPVPDLRPTYVGLGNTAVAPVAFGAPLTAGVIADAFGFEAVFGAAAACGMVGLGLLVWRVRDPRQESARLPGTGPAR